MADVAEAVTNITRGGAHGSLNALVNMDKFESAGVTVVTEF
ncbi:hypothetical protein [Vreelandella sp. GE22]